MLSYGPLLTNYLIQAATSYENNLRFSESSEKLPELIKDFLDENNEDFCQQAFRKFSMYFGQLARKL